MKKNKLNDRKRTFLLITIPIVALFFCFNTLPLIKGVIYSFTNFKGYGSYDWVGLRNYKDLFTDSRVGGSYIFTFKLAIAATILTNVLSLLMALGLNSKIKFKSALRVHILSRMYWEHWCRIHFQLFLYVYPPCIWKNDRK